MIRFTQAGFVAAFLGFLALPHSATAQQIGYPPERSPFADVPYKQSLGLFTGYYRGNRGSAGVAPGGGAAVGVRYQIRLGGPAYFAVRVTQTFSTRMVKDPAQLDANRNLGEQPWHLLIGDLGLSINLTGQKTYHGFIPALNGGIGLASDMGKNPDVGGFDFGTPFAFSFGAGLRYLPGGRYEIRADLANYFAQISYPEAYRQARTGGTSLLKPTSGLSEWKLSPVLSLGISYLYSR
ncbi:MAG: hypothetical protein ACR2OG_07165 [Gemmatimonadaceae bacterium]